MEEYNGISCIINDVITEPDAIISTDASSTGMGGFCAGDYFHTPIPIELLDNSEIFINELECAAVVVALKIWAEELSGQKIAMYCNNETTVTVINAGKARNSFTNSCLREILYLASKYSFQISMIHLPSTDNRLADYLSRWDNDLSFKDKFFLEVALDYDPVKIKQVLVSRLHFQFSHDW